MNRYRDAIFMNEIATNAESDYENQLNFILDEIEEVAKEGGFKTYFKYSCELNETQFHLLIDKLNALGYVTYNEKIEYDDFSLNRVIEFDVSWKLITKNISLPPSTAEYKKKYLAWLSELIKDLEQ